MIARQRKAHRTIWLLLALTVPVLIGLSVHSIRERLVTDANATISSGIETLYEDDQFSISSDGNVITLALKRPLKSASAVLYGSVDGKDIVLGTIAHKGLYSFPIDKVIQSLSIKDPIKEEELINISL